MPSPDWPAVLRRVQRFSAGVEDSPCEPEPEDGPSHPRPTSFELSIDGAGTALELRAGTLAARRAIAPANRPVFLAAMEEAFRFGFDEPETHTLGGVRFTATIKAATGVHTFDSVSPSKLYHPGPHGYFTALLEAAAGVFVGESEPAIEACLRWARGALRVGLCLDQRDALELPPSIPAHVRRDLAERLESVRGVVSLRSLDLSDTAYVELLLELDRREAYLAWQVPPAVREVLLARGVAASRLFATFREADHHLHPTTRGSLKERLQPHLRKVPGVIGFRGDANELLVVVSRRRPEARQKVERLLDELAPGEAVRVVEDGS